MELGRSADGAHMAQTRAGSSTGSVQNAAGLLDNAKYHIYHEDATVAKTKATGPGSGKDGSLTLILSLIVHSVSLSVYSVRPLCLRLQTCQCQKIWTGSRLGTAVEGLPYKTPSSLQERVMARGHCRPAVSCGSLHLRYTPNLSICTADFYYAVKKKNTIIKKIKKTAP